MRSVYCQVFLLSLLLATDCQAAIASSQVPVVVPLRIVGHAAIVMATIDGVIVPLQVDSGDSTTAALQKTVLDRVGATPTAQSSEQRWLNAAAFIGPRAFKARTVHRFAHGGAPAIATIDHKLQLRKQTMTEQVLWTIGGRPEHRDRTEKLRLLFPQELAFHLEVAGFRDATLTDDYGHAGADISGRRLIAVAHPSKRKGLRRP